MGQRISINEIEEKYNINLNSILKIQKIYRKHLHNKYKKLKDDYILLSSSNEDSGSDSKSEMFRTSSDEEELEELKELKENCKEKGLKVSGTKAVLLKRLKSPSVKDMTLSKNKDKVVVGVGWGETDKSNQLGQLIQKVSRLVYIILVMYFIMK